MIVLLCLTVDQPVAAQRRSMSMTTQPRARVSYHTFRRAAGAITEWLRTHDTSPRTGAKLESKTLIPNYSLRSIICSFVEASAAAS
jgi:hypothetical protein